ncbi:predicted protein [Histoplasma mississippiense (nom. inval.)]|uniref:predicted protein n=1 Tax=Ajellomyces capsulatus (strain NAm1 / WU24) TaxID=2059318 RepID=UPI000157CB9D|nr:predicted protein [Histoplasma mississippiense (nom. inval.)]EDN10497.1 predicted protein [Histoplasma mississippiense (nom. inval.)]
MHVRELFCDFSKFMSRCCIASSFAIEMCHNSLRNNIFTTPKANYLLITISVVN